MILPKETCFKSVDEWFMGSPSGLFQSPHNPNPVLPTQALAVLPSKSYLVQLPL